MLPYNESGSGAPALVFMPFLGGSQREWSETVSLLSASHRCITVDLPGFGAAAATPGYSVSEMADCVVERLLSLHIGPYVLVGHSMAAKVSAVVARRLLDSNSAIAAPVALVLVAPSPPEPEPMSDSKREEMLESLGNRDQAGYTESNRPAAEQFLRDNIAHPIQDGPFRRTVDDVLKMHPAAWTAWLESGSKEDWGGFVGVIDLPTLIIAGKRDQALGPDAQRVYTLPHFQPAILAEVDCSHLIPLEKPAELASLISNFLEEIKFGAHA